MAILYKYTFTFIRSVPPMKLLYSSMRLGRGTSIYFLSTLEKHRVFIICFSAWQLKATFTTALSTQRAIVTFSSRQERISMHPIFHFFISLEEGKGQSDRILFSRWQWLIIGHLMLSTQVRCMFYIYSHQWCQLHHIEDRNKLSFTNIIQIKYGF